MKIILFIKALDDIYELIEQNTKRILLISGYITLIALISTILHGKFSSPNFLSKFLEVSFCIGAAIPTAATVIHFLHFVRKKFHYTSDRHNSSNLNNELMFTSEGREKEMEVDTYEN